MTFFHDILPTGCAYYVTAGGKPGDYVHKLTTIDDIEKVVNNYDDTNVWFSYHGYSLNADGRTSANAVDTKCFVFDIDPRKDKGYPTKEEAITAFIALVKNGSLPKPSYVVDSGYGYHIYWVLTDAIDTLEWSETAIRFKAYLKHLDLRLAVDTTRVSDMAGLLRVPGTNNFKNPSSPRRCQLVVASDKARYTHEQFAGAIPTEFTNTKRKPKGNFMSVNSTDNRDHDAVKVLAGCGALKQYYADRATATEPQWRSVLQLMTFTRQGVKAAHIMSKGYDGYSEDETDDKYHKILRQTEEGGIGPITCSQFCGELGYDRSVVCAGCPLVSRSSSPVWRDTFAEEAKAKVVTLSPAKQATAEKPSGVREVLAPGIYVGCSPLEEISVSEIGDEIDINVPVWLDEANERNTFFVRGDCLYWRKKVKKKSEGSKESDGDVVDEFEIVEILVIGNAFWPVDMPYSTSRTGDLQAVMAYMMQGRINTIEVSTTSFTTPAELRSVAAKSFGAPFATVDKGAIDAYVAYIGKVMARNFVRRTVAVDKLGWDTEGGFVLGDKRMVLDGNGGVVLQPTRTFGSLRNFMADGKRFSVEGSIEKQIEVLRTYGTHGSDVAKFLVAAGFAAPLMRFTNTKGLLIHVKGGTGVGKTSVQEFIDGIYGKPEGNRIAGVTGDTDKGTQSVLALTSSLPICIDELRANDVEKLQQFIYSLTQGRDNVARTQHGGLRQSEGGWQTLMISSGNVSLNDVFGRVVTESSRAVTKRFIELDMNVTSLSLPKEELSRVKYDTSHNYGHLGRMFMAWVVKHMDWCAKRVAYHIEQLSGEENTDDRFVREIAAAITVAGEIMQYCDMWGVTAEELSIIAYRLREQNTTRNTMSAFDGVAYIRDFLSRNRSNIVMFKSGASNISINHDGQAVNTTRDNPVARLTTTKDTQELIIRRAAFDDYVTERGDDANMVLSLLASSRILRCNENGCSHNVDFFSNVPIGIGGVVAGMKGIGDIECYVVELPHKTEEVRHVKII